MNPIYVLNFRDVPKYEGKIKYFINTTSRSNDWGKGFSPFFVGPVSLYGDYAAKNVENAWQFSKLYPQHADAEGNPTEAYFDWARQGWNDNYAHRYPMGKGAIPLCSLWNGEKLNYIEARKKIYVPLYAQGAVKTEAFAKFRQLYAAGESLALLDFDAYDYVGMGLTLNQVLNDEKRKMGHAFVLAMLLASMSKKSIIKE